MPNHTAVPGHVRLTYKNLAWWSLLLVATLAIPAFSLMVVAAFRVSELSQSAIFVGTCWLCVFLGKTLVRNPAVTPFLFGVGDPREEEGRDDQRERKLAYYKSHLNYSNASWWLLLTMAVLVVPAVAVLLVTAFDASDTTESVIFIVACWLSVFFGLRLIKDSPITPYIFDTVTLSEQARKRCIGIVGLIEAESVHWERRYEKCEPVFMSLARQPAWDYVAEITRILSRIKRTNQQDEQLAIADVKLLAAWVESPKPAVVQGYVQSLEAIYNYAKAEYAYQGKDIDALYPELNGGQLEHFANAPLHAKTFAQELLATIRKEHSFLA